MLDCIRGLIEPYIVRVCVVRVRMSAYEALANDFAELPPFFVLAKQFLPRRVGFWLYFLGGKSSLLSSSYSIICPV